MTNCESIIVSHRRQTVHYDEKIREIIQNLEENKIISK